MLSAKELKYFEDKHKAEKEKVKELEYKKSTISAEISKLQERKEEVKKQIPTLELEQKKYADLKNFKAAGIKKGEIKDINDEIGKIKDRLDGYLGEEHGLEIEYEEVLSGQKEANEEEGGLLRNVAERQIRFNELKLPKLEEYQREFQKIGKTSSKEKERIERELSTEIERVKEESKYLAVHYEIKLGHSQHQVEDEEEAVAEEEERIQGDNSN